MKSLPHLAVFGQDPILQLTKYSTTVRDLFGGTDVDHAVSLIQAGKIKRVDRGCFTVGNHIVNGKACTCREKAPAYKGSRLCPHMISVMMWRRAELDSPLINLLMGLDGNTALKVTVSYSSPIRVIVGDASRNFPIADNIKFTDEQMLHAANITGWTLQKNPSRITRHSWNFRYYFTQVSGSFGPLTMETLKHD